MPLHRPLLAAMTAACLVFAGCNAISHASSKPSDRSSKSASGKKSDAKSAKSSQNDSIPNAKDVGL